jgi:hypothetical protein
MVNKLKVLFPVVAIILVMLFSGCTSQVSVSNLTPEQVVINFWNDIGKGDYSSAYDLAYHSDKNFTKQMWLDEHIEEYGENGSYITIYSLNVTGITPINGSNSPINASNMVGNFTDAVILNTNATIAYHGQNVTGNLSMVVVNTTDGWKLYSNF